MNDVSVYQRILITLGGLSIALFISGLAYFKGYFRSLVPNRNIPISFSDVISVLLMLLLVRLVIAPATFVVGYTLMTGESLDQEAFAHDSTLQGIFSILVVVQLLICYGLYLYSLRPQVRPIVFGTSTNPADDLSLGFLSWLIAYPWVFTVSQAVETFIAYFSFGPHIEQEAIQFFRGITTNFAVVIVSFLVVALIVPIIEEIVFRGFVQQWLKRYMNPLPAIILTGIAFSLAHFSGAQGISNIPLITALFILSLFLGFLRERQGNLLAPIALHAMVNTITLFIILLQEHSDETITAITNLLGICHIIR